MKTYTPEQLKDIIALHLKWINGNAAGSRANLSGADLSGADLSGANLSEADLSWANLSRADLSWANLSRANLSGANLSEADLSWANLSRANLSGADLSGANLSRANLANIKYDAKTYISPFLIFPEDGAFIAWKKAGGRIIKLEIPATAKRTCTPVGRKCRAEFAYVLAIEGDDEAVSEEHGPRTVYRVGEIVRPDSYDPDWRIECSHGIHFFMTRKEAEDF